MSGLWQGGRTLEPQLLAANDRDTLNEIFGTSFGTDDALVDYMTANKTTCALAIFESETKLNMPGYIHDAVR